MQGGPHSHQPCRTWVGSLAATLASGTWATLEHQYPPPRQSLAPRVCQPWHRQRSATVRVKAGSLVAGVAQPGPHVGSQAAQGSGGWMRPLTRKSMPTVEMKDPARKAPSLKRTSRQVFPTPESPTSITWGRRDTALATPLGQWPASALLPQPPGAPILAKLRRNQTLGTWRAGPSPHPLKSPGPQDGPAHPCQDRTASALGGAGGVLSASR